MRFSTAVLAVLTLVPCVPGADRDSARFLITIAGAADLGITEKGPRPLRLVKPMAVAVDNASRLFIADPGNQAVVVYDKQGQSAACWSGNSDSPMPGPAALAFDSSGRLFVADIYKSQIIIFNPDGKAVASFGKGQMRRPAGLAIDTTRGRLYVADFALRQVLTYDLQTLTGGNTISATGLTDGKDLVPTSIAVDSLGQVYVSDLRHCCIQVFDVNGAFVREIKLRCSGPRELSRPITIGRDDLLYVADPSNNSVDVFDTDGRTIVTAELGKADEPAFETTGITVDAKNRIYVVGRHANNEGRVHVYQLARGKRAR